MRRLVHIREQLDHLERSMPETRPQPRWQRSAHGQLMLHIDNDVLCELVELQFTDHIISNMLGVSISTIERRRRELGLRKRGGPVVSEEELHAAIKSTYALGFEAGERGMRGALRLWHIDGHHKLIKYKIVIHGGVDGKSRTVTFMQANSNNRAETVTTCFLAGVQRWGWPSRVRADHGGENLGVMQVMEQARGQGRGSFIQGPSTRNQRIERMWVDVQRWNTAKYKAMFETLEDDGILDVASPIHLWVLHVVFLPQLNRALQHFADVWNRHPIRTANHNWSPEQKHTAGVLDAERKGFDLRAQPAALEDEEAGEHLRQHAMRNFAEYGDDIPRRGRERRADDPHVVVEPVDRGVSALLLDLEVQSWIEAQVPLAWPPGEDLGIGRYSRTLDVVVDLLKEQ
ncbi:hypothetical protein A4X03_0g9094, partial [Tilletia caries]